MGWCRQLRGKEGGGSPAQPVSLPCSSPAAEPLGLHAASHVTGGPVHPGRGLLAPFTDKEAVAVEILEQATQPGRGGMGVPSLPRCFPRPQPLGPTGLTSISASVALPLTGSAPSLLLSPLAGPEAFSLSHVLGF